MNLTNKEKTELAQMIAAQIKEMGLVTNEQFMNTKEACDFIRIPKGTFDQMIDQIPHKKIGKRNIFMKSQLIDFVREF